MLPAIDADLEQEIYEAAVVSENWLSVLQRLASLSGAVGSIIFCATDKGSNWRATPSIHTAAERFFTEGWVNRNTRTTLALAKGLGSIPRFITEVDIYDGDDYERDPLYVDYFRPNGMGWSAGTVFALPHGDLITLSMERAYESGPIPTLALEQLNSLRPHLGRSALLAARLAFERLRTAVETLSALGLPAFAVGRNGRVSVANREFATEHALWTTRGGDRIGFADKSADRLFHEALSIIATPQGVRSIPLRGVQSGDRAVVHLVPVRRAAHDLFSQAVAIGVVTRDNTQPAKATGLLQALFDLTASEAKVASLIAAGQTIADIACLAERSEMTVRQHVKNVLHKTGCERQADLTRLLTRLLPPTL